MVAPEGKPFGAICLRKYSSNIKRQWQNMKKLLTNEIYDVLLY